jgi:hypothetical protein
MADVKTSEVSKKLAADNMVHNTVSAYRYSKYEQRLMKQINELSGRVVSTPISYSQGPGFISLLGDRML